MDLHTRRFVTATLGGLLLALSSGMAHAQASGPKALVVAEDVVPQTFDPTQSSQTRPRYAWPLVTRSRGRPHATGTHPPPLGVRQWGAWPRRG